MGGHKAGDFASKYTVKVLHEELEMCIRDRYIDMNRGFDHLRIQFDFNPLNCLLYTSFEKPNKVHTLFPEEIQVKMWPLPIGELYMAGRSSVAALEKLEVRTIGDLAQMDVRLIELHLKSHGRKLWEFSNGIDASQVESERAEAKGCLLYTSRCV